VASFLRAGEETTAGTTLSGIETTREETTTGATTTGAETTGVSGFPSNISFFFVFFKEETTGVVGIGIIVIDIDSMYFMFL